MIKGETLNIQKVYAEKWRGYLPALSSWMDEKFFAYNQETVIEANIHVQNFTIIF